MIQIIVYIVLALIVGFILLVMLMGKILDKGFENREDPKILSKWKEKDEQGKFANKQQKE